MKGLRAMPPALVVAYALAIASMLARAVYYTAVDDAWSDQRFELSMRGLAFCYELLGLIGMLELSRRVTWRAAIGCTIAVIGFALELAVDLTWTMVMFKSRIWEHQWILDANQWAWWVASSVVLAGIVVAAWDRLPIAIATLVVGALVIPPPVLAKHLYSWMPEGKATIGISYALSVARFVLLVIAIASFARGAPPIDRRAAAGGMRSCASALWLRIIAAICVVLLTLLGMAGARRGEGGAEVLKLATMSGAIINIAALVWFGTGALRAASAGIGELNRYMLVIAGAASLWGAGVVEGQLPHLYHMLYKPDSILGSGEAAKVLTVAMPLVVTGGIALIALVIGGFAAQRRAEELRAQAQASGIAFVLLLLVSLAIQAWLLPKAGSLGSLAMISLLAAGAALLGTMLIAKLCTMAADELEQAPGLPAARIVSDGT